ncbi:PREDICTED: probable phospholipid-transporting ATPase FetA-like [Chrysochloris asiatica]|uniref:Phospholipid-transporting ATPase n=1 Tax=Chrysochloris asiatica TaxID=185453 RepID=A0A9B0TEZ3_CHRAS|nr:PREDICTED: probable phospholipid-transporting ATPase FetA-like [Chrysochloris asiatica]
MRGGAPLCGGKRSSVAPAQKEQDRRLQANNREFNTKFGYPSNTIKTSKYSLLNFLPMNLFEQFQRLANAYFLILLCLQLIPQISSLAWYSTVIPLMVVLSITGVKDAIDDLKRHRSDKQVNNRPVLLLVNGKVEEDKWMNVQVGDIIKLENNHMVTADILLLSSSEPYSLTYIETTELDGETNLKVKHAVSVTSEMEDNLELLSAFDGNIRCEPPNNKLDKFTGILTYKDNKYLLDQDKLLLRGCTIRNTDWCYGLVIYTGPDTKLMQNSGKSTFKRTRIDHLMNVLVIWIFLVLGIICFALAIGHSIWENKKGHYFQIFLPRQKYVPSSFVSAVLVFWSYIIILNTVVPISLYVSVEIIRLGNSYYINWDQKMFCAPRNTPAQARTTTLNEELGQVKYVFSDKTGTLTQNIMIFNKCSINGKFYGNVFDKNGQKVEISEQTEKVDFSYNKLADPKFSFYDKTLVEAVKNGDHWVHLFFLSLSLCHTVMSEEKVEGELVYQAQSPDEGALVTAARNFGFVFRSRTSETITIVEMGITKVYKLLAILDFNNVRKRMSVIVQTPENRIMLFCKGADTILCQLLHPSCRFLQDMTMDHLDNFASEGLRTLMVAYRELDDAFYQDWSSKHTEAYLSLENREDKLSDIYEEIEKDLMLIGATAIEDKLQDGVPETIITLNKAKIKLWVLTGDKQETAVNIAYSCNIFNEDMDGVFLVEGSDNETVLKELRSARNQIKPESLLKTDPINIHLTTKPRKPLRLPEEEPNGNYGLVINGYSMAYALERNLELELLRTACMCNGVVCCRMTPLQKAQVVELVKRYKKVVTLAIGDGANDVGMIKAAHVGVGISGQEGMQAMLSSDFTFSQFQYLQRLLLVHGRWSYNRMCKFLSYFFYKNFAFTLVHIWYAFFNGFSAQTVYDNWFITFYNLVYTSLPILGLSLFDQDINGMWSLHIPELYEPGQANLYFNRKAFVKCLIHGIYSSLVLFFVPMKTIYNSVRNDGKEMSGYQSFSVIVQTSLLCVMTIQIALETTYWTFISHFFTWGSLSFYFWVLFFLYSDDLFLMFPNVFQFHGVARNTLNQPQVWLSVILSVALCVLPVMGYQLLKPIFWPIGVDKALSRIRDCMKRPLAPRAQPKRRYMGPHRSAYAFSHKSGFGALITSGKTMKYKLPKKSNCALKK